MSAPDPRFATIVLAAGDSERMGEDKALLPFGSSSDTVVETLCRRAREAGSDIVIVCTSTARREAVSAALSFATVQIVPDDERARGPVASIRHAIANCPATEAWLIWPVDHPFVRVDTLRRLVHARAMTASPICVPECGGRGGHPVVIAASERDALLRSTAEEGTTLRDFIGPRREHVHRVPIDDHAIHWNCNDRARYDAGYDRFEV